MSPKNKPPTERAQAFRIGSGATCAIRAEMIGNDTCIALGVTAHSYTPVLQLCCSLIERGHDPDRPLEAWRGKILCLHVRSIGVAAELEVNSKGTGFIKAARAVRTAPSVAPAAKRHHKQAPSSARSARP